MTERQLNVMLDKMILFMHLSFDFRLKPGNELMSLLMRELTFHLWSISLRCHWSCVSSWQTPSCGCPGPVQSEGRRGEWSIQLPVCWQHLCTMRRASSVLAMQKCVLLTQQWTMCLWTKIYNVISIDRSINQSINQPINQPINQSIDQSIDQSINRSINQYFDYISIIRCLCACNTTCSTYHKCSSA